MKNIKDITISIFAIIGFVAIISGFTNQAEQSTQPTYGTPESHVWELQTDNSYAYVLNKQTGEVRKYFKLQKFGIKMYLKSSKNE